MPRSRARAAAHLACRRDSFVSRRLDAGGTVATYVYRWTVVPKPGDEPVRLNLWPFGGAAPTDGQPVEIVVESFAYVP